MLQSYQEEVRRKRNAYRVFWLVVFCFAFLLYMFFQGYYISIQVGFEDLIRATKSHTSSQTSTPSQVVRSFGIVNIQVDPNPAVLNINGQRYQNGAKSIFDYGKYRIDIEDPTYVPIHIETSLDRQNPFYINIIRLLKTPTSTELPRVLEKVDTLANGKYIAKVSTGSGKTNYEVFDSTFVTGSSLTGVIGTGSVSYIGDRYFKTTDKLALYDEATETLRPYERPKSLTGAICPDIKSIKGDLYCSGSGMFLTGKYATSKDKIIEANDRIIRTATTITQNGGGFFSSAYTLSGGLTITGSTDLVRYEDNLLMLANSKLWNIEKNGSLKVIVPFNRVDHVANFPDETLVFGHKVDGTTTFSLFDARGNVFSLDTPTLDFGQVSVTKHSGAYVINTGKQVFLYYKGGTGIITIAEGEILGVFDRIILFNKDGKTHRMELEGVE